MSLNHDALLLELRKVFVSSASFVALLKSKVLGVGICCATGEGAQRDVEAICGLDFSES
jgi:hypothetical protein